MTIEKAFAGAYDVLVDLAGANPEGKADFVAYHAQRHSPSNRECAFTTEYRIQGLLGGGGKFWVDLDGFRVNFYPEDRTDERVVIRTETNKRLLPFFQMWHSAVQGGGEPLTEEQRASLLEGGLPCDEYPCEETATYMDEADFAWCSAHGPHAKK